MIKLNQAFAFACLLFLFVYTIEGFGKEDVEPSERPHEATSAKPMAGANQTAVLNYSWRVLDTVTDQGTRCRNERCFREGDLIFVAHDNNTESPSKDELTLVMYDLSSRDIKRFPGMNGVIKRSEKPQPTATAVQFYFLDSVDQSPGECRKLAITPVRMTGATSVRQCSDKLFELSNFADRTIFDLVFGQACSLDTLLHWRVSDAESKNCDGTTTQGLKSPPESGQGTASGGGFG